MKDHRDLIIRTFNAFDKTKVHTLGSFYSDEAVFEDPVVRRQGLEEIKKYYAHAYKNVKSIRFDFDEIFSQGTTYTAPWTMVLSVQSLNGGKPYSVRGVSLLRFNEGDRVVHHRDYLDLGELVYERVPAAGLAVSWLKKMLS